MKIASLHVQNYRGLRDVAIPISQFGCLIGENNSGKSSVLQTLTLFFSGSAIGISNFFDPKISIRIELKLTDITQGDLDLLGEDHGPRIADIVEQGCLTLVRSYSTDGKSKLRYVAWVPVQSRFRDENVGDLVKGKRGKQLVEDVGAVFPELEGDLTNASTITQVRDAIRKLAGSISRDEKEQLDIDLPTGIDKSIMPLLPSPLYIPAVKDLSDDIKTKEGTPFGKILGMLLRVIEPQLADAKELFDKLDSQLNRVVAEDGIETDGRLEEIKEIEQTVEHLLQQSFSNVTIRIRIPPPELKTVLSGAQIHANDGVDGPIETKGDGLRRAVVFSIFRAYVELGRSKTFSEEPGREDAPRYFLLFEEPELYLHPHAQRILFEALSIFSKNNYVLVTTHSPAFLGPQATATFVKLRKSSETSVSKPFTRAHPVDMTDMKAKDQFQIICYENNNAAFFANTVVLVEGDSDFLVLPHIAGVLNADWICGKTQVQFCKINGKSSIRRYREFFLRFDARVVVITDLDIVLDGFAYIDPEERAVKCRESLLAALDGKINLDADVTQTKAKEAQKKLELVGLWKKAKEAVVAFREGRQTADDADKAVNEFFQWEHNDRRLRLLRDNTDASICALKRDLLSHLRSQDVFVLEAGSIEAYYPPTLPSADKPTRAQAFCQCVGSREQALALCNDIDCGGGVSKKEFEVIFEKVFGQPSRPRQSPPVAVGTSRPKAEPRKESRSGRQGKSPARGKL